MLAELLLLIKSTSQTQKTRLSHPRTLQGEPKLYCVQSIRAVSLVPVHQLESSSIASLITRKFSNPG